MRSSAALALGGFALFGFLRRRKQQPAPLDEPDPRAEELRQKLAESRAIVAERDEFEGAETPVDEVQQPLEDPETRRRAVHEAARETAERMRERH